MTVTTLPERYLTPVDPNDVRAWVGSLMEGAA